MGKPFMSGLLLSDAVMFISRDDEHRGEQFHFCPFDSVNNGWSIVVAGALPFRTQS
jgi:hypothetical protein